MTAPSATVSLVTHDGMRWLPACLDSIKDQRAVELELQIVDNASTDGTREWLAERAALDGRISLELRDANLGFGAAHNRNIERARCETVVILNQDVVLEPGFVRRAVDALAADPSIGSVQGHVWRLGPDGSRLQVVDTTGLEMARDRRATSRDQGTATALPMRPAGPVWGVDGPVAVYRRAALRDARLPRADGRWEVFDEDFFMYKEDVDLAWRLRLLGWSVRYEPASQAWHARLGAGHAGSGSIGLARSKLAQPHWIRALSWRNQHLMQAKNESLSGYLSDLPWIARHELLEAVFTLLADPRRLGAVSQFLRLLPSAAAKRRRLMRQIAQSADGRARLTRS